MSIKEEATTAVAVMQAQLEIEFAHDGNRPVKFRPAPYVALPVIGGPDADIGETDVFVSQSWRDKWKPGPEICVYVGANEMWRSYAGTTRPPITRWASRLLRDCIRDPGADTRRVWRVSQEHIGRRRA